MMIKYPFVEQKYFICVEHIPESRLTLYPPTKKKQTNPSIELSARKNELHFRLACLLCITLNFRFFYNSTFRLSFRFHFTHAFGFDFFYIDIQVNFSFWNTQTLLTTAYGWDSTLSFSQSLLMSTEFGCHLERKKDPFLYVFTVILFFYCKIIRVSSYVIACCCLIVVMKYSISS